MGNPAAVASKLISPAPHAKALHQHTGRRNQEQLAWQPQACFVLTWVCCLATNALCKHCKTPLVSQRAVCAMAAILLLPLAPQELSCPEMNGAACHPHQTTTAPAATRGQRAAENCRKPQGEEARWWRRAWLGTGRQAARPQRARSRRYHPSVLHPTQAAGTSTSRSKCQCRIPGANGQHQHHSHGTGTPVGPFLSSLPQTPFPGADAPAVLPTRSTGVAAWQRVAAWQSAAPGPVEAVAGTYWAKRCRERTMNLKMYSKALKVRMSSSQGSPRLA